MPSPDEYHWYEVPERIGLQSMSFRHVADQIATLVTASIRRRQLSSGEDAFQLDYMLDTHGEAADNTVAAMARGSMGGCDLDALKATFATIVERRTKLLVAQVQAALAVAAGEQR